MKGKSTETALHKVLSLAEKAIQHKQMALTALLDIEGAFNNVKTNAIRNALLSVNTNPFLVNWITSMLNTRIV